MKNLKLMVRCSCGLLALGLVFAMFIGRVEAETPVAFIGGNRCMVRLEVAQTPEQIHYGLMYRTSLPDDAGMVFLFNPPASTRFWMYHTLIPLDLIFVNGGKILKLCENVPPCKSENPAKCPKYPSEGNIAVTEVVEVNGGYCRRHGIREGDNIQFAIGSFVAPSTTSSVHH